MEPAVLVVSFGTTHLDTMEKTITRTEADIAAAFPGCPLYRAFTSNMVRAKLAKVHKIHVDSVAEALARIAADGHTQAVVQPTLLIPGEEYDRLCAAVREAAGPLKTAIGRPLLDDDGDLDRVTSIFREAYPVPADTVLLAMGHGTAHGANRIYEVLAEKFRAQVGVLMRLCTVEGTPTFADAVAELTALPQRKALLAPLLLVAGEHTKSDLAGPQPGSLRSQLVQAGFQVDCALRGLGELSAVRKMYVRRVQEAMRIMTEEQKMMGSFSA